MLGAGVDRKAVLIAGVGEEGLFAGLRPREQEAVHGEGEVVLLAAQLVQVVRIAQEHGRLAGEEAVDRGLLVHGQGAGPEEAPLDPVLDALGAHGEFALPVRAPVAQAVRVVEVPGLQGDVIRHDAPQRLDLEPVRPARGGERDEAFVQGQLHQRRHLLLGGGLAPAVAVEQVLVVDHDHAAAPEGDAVQAVLQGVFRKGAGLKAAGPFLVHVGGQVQHQPLAVRAAELIRILKKHIVHAGGGRGGLHLPVHRAPVHGVDLHAQGFVLLLHRADDLFHRLLVLAPNVQKPDGDLALLFAGVAGRTLHLCGLRAAHGGKQNCRTDRADPKTLSSFHPANAFRFINITALF